LVGFVKSGPNEAGWRRVVEVREICDVSKCWKVVVVFLHTIGSMCTDESFNKTIIV